MEKFSKLRVRARIALIFFFVILLYTANSCYTLVSINSIENASQDRLISTTTLLEADRDSYQSKTAILEIILLLSSQEEPSEKVISAKLEEVNSNLEQILQRFTKFKDIYLATGGENHNEFQTFQQHYDMIKQLTESINTLATEKSHALIYQTYLNEYTKHYDTMRNAVDKLTEASLGRASEEYQANQDQIKGLVYTGIGQLVVVIGLLIASGMFLTQSIVVQLGCEPFEAAEIAADLANGNLFTRISKQNEMGLFKDFKETQKRLREVIERISSVSESLAHSSIQFSSSAHQTAQGSNDQAASVEEISSAMEEMTSIIEQNTEYVSETEGFSKEAAHDIINVKDKAMIAIDANNKIEEKIEMINDIAFQTNILALNASVEAARAGEYGSGFAAVAAEVRKLAKESKTAAGEIIKIVKMSVKANNQTGELLINTLPNIEKTATLLQEVHSASREQVNGVREVNMAVQQVNSVTQQTTATSEELASISEEVANQAYQLQELVSFFKTDEFEKLKKETPKSKPVGKESSDEWIKEGEF